MDTSENRDEEINVEEIMRKIKENIKTRNDLPISADEIRRDLDYINSKWDIQNDSYFISSHRPIAGKALTKGRELIHGEVKRYVDPMMGKQSDFNRSVARTLIGLEKQIKHDIPTQVISIVEAMNQEIENRAWLANILDKKIRNHMEIETSIPAQELLGLNYFLFEEQFRGSRADIKQRQSAFVHYFEGCRNVLDIGCGRGEFLELVKEQGIVSKGVDVNEDMVNFCKSKGLDVELIDAISYLEKIEDKTLDGIFVDQVVEHLEPDYIIKMIGLSYKKLIYGGAIVVETVNPLSFASFANFYIDMSHKRPIHPETMKFILSSAGFREIETKFLAPVQEEVRLRRIDIEYNDERDKRLIENYNHNIDMINGMLFGAQDYAVIGRK